MSLFRMVALVAALPLLAAGQFIGAGSFGSLSDREVLRTPGFNGKAKLPQTRNSTPAPAGGILSTPSPGTRQRSVLRPPSVGEMILTVPRRSPGGRSNNRRSCIVEPDEAAIAKQDGK